MELRKVVRVSREEIQAMIERKHNLKFSDFKLSSKGAKGETDADETRRI